MGEQRGGAADRIVLSIVVPIYNERETIAKLLDALAGVSVEHEVIVVNDGSTDGVEALLEGPLSDRIDHLEHHRVNRGKGAAVRTALPLARGRYLIIQDADLEYDPREIPKLLGPLRDGRADVVYGSRFLGGEPHRVLYFWHYVGNKLLTLLCNLFSNLNLSDMETCYKAFRTDLIQGVRLREERFGFEPEVTLKLARVPGIRIYEIGISYAGRTYEEGKKIRWRDGLSAVLCILRYGLLRLD